ncbi:MULTISPECIES: AI-2E family transporter [Bacillus]|uniref:AI-2E family transporter n=1 Tax=Bacillus TaxID=1386 RepID=UPI0003195E25|nr:MULTISPECIES: AI-2E family transporter [Bacillus]
MNMKWFYRLGFLLLIFFVVFIFFKMKPIWLPIIHIIFTTLLPFVIAAFISYLLHPVVETLYKKGLYRSVSILFIYLLFFGGVGFALYKGIPIVINELEDLMEQIPTFTAKYQGILDSIDRKTSKWPVEYKDKVQDAILFFERKIEDLLMKITGYLIKLFDFAILFMIIPVIAFYLLKDWERIKETAKNLTPLSARHQSTVFLGDVEKSLGSYIRGQLIVCVIIGALSALLLWLLKVKYSLLLGLIIGITNVIPYFGPIIGAIPALVIAMATSPKQVIWVAVIIFGLQFLEGNILSPLIVGKSLHMHPLIIILGLFVGGEIGGILGMLVAVPVLAILKVAIMHAKVHFKKEQQRVQE